MPTGGDRLRALIEADPEAAVKLFQSLKDKVVVPHEGGQAEVMASKARFMVLDAGRRWGKTKIGAKRCLTHARKEKQMIWWVAPTYRIVKRGYREILRQLPDGVLSKPPPPDTAFDSGRAVVLNFKNGSRMEFYSAERPEGMLGEGVDFAVMDEAALMNKNIWDQIVRPTLMDREGGALMISTPRGRNWFYECYLRGQDDQYPDWQSWRFPTASNPHISDDEVEEMRKTLPSVMFEQEVLADFISDAAAVFRFKDEAVVKLSPPQGHVFMGVDLAKSRDFTVLTAARAKDRFPCFHERFNAVSWPEQKRRIRSAVARLEQDGASGVTLLVDSTGLGDPIVDDLELEGYDVIGIVFTPKWKHQAVMLLASDLEQGHAYLCQEAVNEFQAYTYEHNMDTGRVAYHAPDGGHDDEVSAKLLEHWGLVQEGVPGVWDLGRPPPADGSDPEEQEEYFMDYDDEASIKDGVVVRNIEARNPSDLINDPNVW